MRTPLLALFVPLALQAGVYFEPNCGQAPAHLAWLARTPRGAIGLAPHRFELATPSGAPLPVSFPGADPRALSQPGPRLPGVSHFVRGRDPRAWLYGVPHFESLRYSSIYPGVDLLFKPSASSVEFDLLLAPGASATPIRLHFEQPVELTPAGALRLAGATLRAPVAFQTSNGARTPVPARFVATAPDEVGFELGPHDPALPLVIDPIIEFASLLGGSLEESEPRLAVNPDGALFLAGTTLSPDFPAALPAGSPVNRPAFLLQPKTYVSRFRADGSTLEWSLFLGSSGAEQAIGLAADPLGNLVLLGATNSPDLPTTPGAFRSKLPLTSDADLFLLRLDAESGRLKAATFLGTGARLDYDSPALLALDAAGSPYVFTYSPDTKLETSPKAYLPAPPTSYLSSAPFVLRLNPGLKTRIYATYLNTATISAIDVAPDGSLLFAGAFSPNTGATFTPVDPFPGTSADGDYRGTAFLSRLNPTGTAITFASLFPTPGDSSINLLRQAPDGSVWLAGTAMAGNFPLVAPLPVFPDNPPKNVTDSGPFLARVELKGSAILHATLFNNWEYAPPNYISPFRALTLLPSGAVCFLSAGNGALLPTPGALVPPASSWSNWSALTCTNPDLTALPVKTKLPEMQPSALAATPDGRLILAGTAYSSFPATPGAFQTKPGGSDAANGVSFFPTATYNPTDAFLLRLSLDNPAPVLESVQPPTLLLSTNQPTGRTLTLSGQGFSYGAAVALESKPVDATIDSSTRITLSSLTVADFHPGPNRLSVSQVAPGGGSSETTVFAFNATPSQLYASPAQVTAGAPETAVVIGGANLFPSSTLRWDGEPRAAEYLASSNGGSLRLRLSAAELATPARHWISVSNPAPGGGASSDLAFTVQPASGSPLLRLASAPVFFSLPDQPPTQLTVSNALGVESTSRALWDGVEVPLELISSDKFRITPPATDFTRWGRHQLVLQNQAGTLRSAPQDFLFGRAVSSLTLQVDPTRRRIFALERNPNTYTAQTLLILDLDSGATLARIPTLGFASGLQLSAENRFLYLTDARDQQAVIRRFDPDSASFDLEFTPTTPDGRSFPGYPQLLPLPGQPGSIIVGDSSNAVIFDGSTPRPRDAQDAGWSVNEGLALSYATNSRLYTRSSEYYPWSWLGYDHSGFTSVLAHQSASLPEDLRTDGPLSYLAGGLVPLPVALPDLVNYYGSASRILAYSPALHRAYLLYYSRLFEFRLDSFEQRELPVGYTGSFANIAATPEGLLLTLFDGLYFYPAQP